MFASTPMGHGGSGMMHSGQYSIPSESDFPFTPRPQLNSHPRQTNHVTHKVVGPWIEGLRKHCASLRQGRGSDHPHMDQTLE